MSQDTDQLVETTEDLDDEQNQPSTVQNSKVLPQYIAASAATLSAFVAGTVLGWTSPIMDALSSGEFNNVTINTSQMGWIGSLTTLGAMSMTIPTGFVCDSIGLKKTLLLTSIPFFIGWSLIIFANSVLFLYFGRILTGMGIGASCVAAPIYVNEISDKNIRGTLGSFFQLMITSGVLSSYIAGSLMSPYNFTVFCSCVPVFFVTAFGLQVESPAYLIKKGLREKAECSLRKLRGTPDIQEELNEIEGVIKEMDESVSGTRQIFQSKKNLKALFIAFSLMFFQQFCGINAVILYSSEIFTKSGIKNVQICVIILGVVQVIATLFSSFLVDKLGRKILMMISSGLVGCANLSLAVFVMLKSRLDYDLEDFWFVPIVSMGLFISMYSIGLGPIPWLMGAEIFVPKVKSIACSWAATFNMFLAFFITKFFLDISSSIGEDNSFLIFSVLSCCGVLFTIFILPETKGKSIEEVQLMLSN